ncbi:hypothetical protein DFA_05807 [Cavenderia fasciculata]|uniref:Ankyrin repeat-containing protein n=1 Tax=Cavenderia fasciculata TaxID=261658 RepID=F4PMS9_CACFS|nr:uncharacterized protein DFA_05807 [Cavenderia fasciculata]EGG23673.1 hypothetical protein DFA_05807 [Cavenderia fasciculata]|eukprot:XP_004361524.1 hypothetical protein DFA_05807 [Cavenderia fasciculata]
MNTFRIIINQIYIQRILFQHVKEIHNRLILNEPNLSYDYDVLFSIKQEELDKDQCIDRKRQSLTFKWIDIKDNICLAARFGYLKLFKKFIKDQELKYSGHIWFEEQYQEKIQKQQLQQQQQKPSIKKLFGTLFSQKESSSSSTTTTTTKNQDVSKKKTFIPYLDRYIERSCKGNHINIVDYLFKRYGGHVEEVSYYIYKWSFHYHRYDIFRYLMELDFNQLFVGIVLEAHYKYINRSDDMNNVPNCQSLQQLIIRCLEIEQSSSSPSDNNWPSVIYPGWFGLLDVDNIKKFESSLFGSYKSDINRSIEFASRYGNLDALKLFVETFKIDCQSGNNSIALGWAVSNNHVNVVIYIIENVIAIPSVSSLATYLETAYTNGYLYLTKYLIERFPNHPPPSIGLACKKGHGFNIVQYLIQQTTLPIDLNVGIDMSVRYQQHKLTHYLLDQLSTIDQIRFNSSTFEFETNTILDAIANEDLSILKRLLVNYNIQGDLLEYVMHSGNQEIFDLVQEKIEMKHLQHKDVFNTMTFLPLLKYIKEKQPNLLINNQDWTIPSLPQNTVKKQDGRRWYDAFYFLAQYKRKDQHFTKEMSTAIRYGHIEIVKWIDENCIISPGHGFLEEIAYSNNMELFDFICLGIGGCHQKYLTPKHLLSSSKVLGIAIENKNIVIVKHLLEVVGVEVDESMTYPLLRMVIDSSNIDLLVYLVQYLKKTKKFNGSSQPDLYPIVVGGSIFTKSIIDYLLSPGVISSRTFRQSDLLNAYCYSLNTSSSIATFHRHSNLYNYNVNNPLNSYDKGSNPIDGIIALHAIDGKSKLGFSIDLPCRTGQLDQIRFVHYNNSKMTTCTNYAIAISLETAQANIGTHCHVANFLLKTRQQHFMSLDSRLLTITMTSPHVSALLKLYQHLGIKEK